MALFDRILQLTFGNRRNDDPGTMVARYVERQVREIEGRGETVGPHLTPEQVSLTLLALLGLDAFVKRSRKLAKDYSNRAAVLMEVVHLQAVAVDFGVYSTYDHSDTWDRIMRAFNKHLIAVFESVPTFKDTMIVRQRLYTSSLKSHYADREVPRSTAGSIGSHFSKLCVEEPEVFLMLHGEFYFWETHKLSKDILAGQTIR